MITFISGNYKSDGPKHVATSAHGVEAGVTHCKVKLIQYQVKFLIYILAMDSCHTALHPSPNPVVLGLSSTQPPLLSGQSNDHPHHQIPQRFPFNCWYENISGQEGRAQTEGSLKHLIQRSARSASLLLPLNSPLKREGGPFHSNSQPLALPAFCPPPQQQFLLQEP